MNGAINVQVVVQLWQIVFAALMGSVTLVGVGFASATLFVRKAECAAHGNDTEKALDSIFTLIRELKEDVGILKGKLGV